MTISHRLARLAIEECPSGEKVRLEHFWQDTSAVIIFIRHFG